MPERSNTSQGFSLPELLVVLAIISIAAATALPSLASFIPDYRLNAAARDVFSNFQRARSIAAKHNVNCAISFNVPVGSVIYDYIVYIDSDGDFEYDAEETLVERVKLRGEGGLRIDQASVTFVDNDLGQPTAAFEPTGLLKRKGNGFCNGTVPLLDQRGKCLKVVAVYSGRIRIDKEEG